MAQGPATSGAYVVNLDDGHVVFDDRGDTKRLSASVTKLYTTSTALIRLGQGTRLSTGVLGTGRRVGTTWTGDLYLRGAGDFTFGTVAFARKAYGSRASVERLATQLRQVGIRHIRGRVLADASLFGDNGGSEFGLVLCRNPLFGPRCPYGPAGRFERPIPQRSTHPDRVQPGPAQRHERCAAETTGQVRSPWAHPRPAPSRDPRRRLPGAAVTPREPACWPPPHPRGWRGSSADQSALGQLRRRRDAAPARCACHRSRHLCRWRQRDPEHDAQGLRAHTLDPDRLR